MLNKNNKMIIKILLLTALTKNSFYLISIIFGKFFIIYFFYFTFAFDNINQGHHLSI